MFTSPTMQSKMQICKTSQVKTKTYIQLFEIVVQEDKLRVGPRNMLHHQVVAEEATVKERRRRKCWKHLTVCNLYTDMFKEGVRAVCQRILKRDVLDHEGFDLQGDVGD